MQFRNNAKVFTANGQEIGKVDRVVLNPRTRVVSHVVVHKGFLEQDKVIPVNLIATTTEDEVILDQRAGDPKKLPVFEEAHYIPVGTNEKGVDYITDQLRSIYFYPPLGLPLETPDYITQMERNIPAGTVALKEGAGIVSADGQNVGHVKRVFTNPGTDRVSHLLISKGVLFKERKLIPVSWIEKVGEYQIHLAVDAELLHSLSPYHDTERKNAVSSKSRC